MQKSLFSHDAAHIVMFDHITFSYKIVSKKIKCTRIQSLGLCLLLSSLFSHENIDGGRLHSFKSNSDLSNISFFQEQADLCLHYFPRPYNISHVMRKPRFCICKNKDADQRLCFHYIVQSLCFLNPKFQASSHLLYLYSLVCVGPGRKPEY